ncbi:TetR/AcrR family transcriptional regulator [Pseudomonas sp. PDM31]|uniref:TetR/AcrR family transcriptional regulator n=1 Tax=Pseudomonas sp. PDM31 TaxID=2854778 RepID=UPI001C450FAD|nr:TetR/AcrR family transcriptional regulator [Pseudomonas sp. PDM31]MBV7477589.1 TetR/AcrR family transcriptional regulator [Pseudomonas sp. PDM31]
MNQPLPNTVSLAGTGSDARGLKLTAQFIALATDCVARVGLDKVSMDDIARATGLSRATLYRHYGSKEGLFAAVLDAQSRPMEGKAQQILTGCDSLPERIAQFICWAVLEVPRNALLKSLLDSGVSRSGIELFSSVFRAKISRILLPVIGAAKARGELRAELDVEEMIEWLVHQLLQIKASDDWTEQRLRHHLDTFVLPVLVPPIARPEPCTDGVELRLARLEARLLEVHQLVALLRQEITIHTPL